MLLDALAHELYPGIAWTTRLDHEGFHIRGERDGSCAERVLERWRLADSDLSVARCLSELTTEIVEEIQPTPPSFIDFTDVGS